MEGAPVTFFRGHNVPPDLREKFQNWRFEAYIPILLKIPGLEGVEYYQINKENPLYPNLLGIFHYSELGARSNRSDTPEWNAVMNDQATTFSRVETFWSKHYFLLRKFTNTSQSINKDPKIGDTSIIHIEAFRLSTEEKDKYNDWFVKWAYRVYIPILMMLPGLKEYDYFQQYERDTTRLNQIVGKPVVTGYPFHISVIHFENLEAFDNYENSPELVAFKRAISLEVSNNLVPDWYVQYRFMRSWRK